MSGPGQAVIRGEQWKMAFAPESTYGDEPVSGSYTRVFGVVQTATIPDPTVDFQPFWGQGTSSARNWYTAYHGRVQLVGGVPDIILLEGRPLIYPIGDVVTVSAITSGVYTHTIIETNTLKSLAWHVTYTDSDGVIQLMRRFLGGKVNRATIEGSEGDFLKMSFDEIDFTSMHHNQSGMTYYNSNVIDVNPVYPTTEPYLFSYGSLSLGGTIFARIRNFRLSISNNLEAKYYVQASGNLFLPYEWREGRREYELTCTVDIEDAALYRELVSMGTYSSVYKGFQTIISFTKSATDNITITMPAATPAPGGDSLGCLIRTAPHNIVQEPIVSVPLSIIGRGLNIIINNTTFIYP